MVSSAANQDKARSCMQAVGGWGTDLELAKLLKKDGAQSVELGRGIAGDVVDLLNGAVVAGREALTVERGVEMRVSSRI